MTLKGAEGPARTLEDLFDRGGESLFRNVDWSRTKAYALGLGNIYVNLYGREPQGIVQEGEEYEKVVRGIKDGLEALVDEKTGERPVTRVYRREEIYPGYDPVLIPDLRPANALGYRVSWQTTLGGVPPDLFDDNLKAWSGDHCSNDPALVKGILFSSRKIERDDPGIIDLFPTILTALGIPVPEGLDGRSLYSRAQ
jgi:predicted AlkP superfamily phosphohydrolase/phosphomutase